MDDNKTALPKRGDKEWKDYVLSQVDKEDIKEGHPSFEGLYKACIRVFGNITDLQTEVNKAPAERDRSATVITYICCEGYDGNQYNFSDVGDCFYYDEGENCNTPHPFHLHLTSTAATKSAGRALRRLLCVNTITYEELSDDKKTFNSAGTVQVTALTNKCILLDIDIDKFLAKYGGISSEQLKVITHQLCKDLISKLNSFANDEEEIPEEIKK